MNFLIKVFITLIFAACFSGNLNAQVPTIQWQKTYGGTNDDEAYSICTLAEGSYVIKFYSSDSLTQQMKLIISK